MKLINNFKLLVENKVAEEVYNTLIKRLPEYSDCLYFGLFKNQAKDWVAFDNRKNNLEVKHFAKRGDALKWLEESQYEYFRICSECNSIVEFGYVVGDELECYCSNECLSKHYSDKEWEKLYIDDVGYYVEFDYSY